MTDEDLAILRQTVIKEAIGIGALMVIVCVFGPGRLWIDRLRHRAEAWREARGSEHDTKIAQFRAEVSRWDHEQAAHENHKAGGGKPCGCG